MWCFRSSFSRTFSFLLLLSCLALNVDENGEVFDFRDETGGTWMRPVCYYDRRHEICKIGHLICDPLDNTSNTKSLMMTNFPAFGEWHFGMRFESPRIKEMNKIMATILLIACPTLSFLHRHKCTIMTMTHFTFTKAQKERCWLQRKHLQRPRKCQSLQSTSLWLRNVFFFLLSFGLGLISENSGRENRTLESVPLFNWHVKIRSHSAIRLSSPLHFKSVRQDCCLAAAKSHRNYLVFVTWWHGRNLNPEMVKCFAWGYLFEMGDSKAGKTLQHCNCYLPGHNFTISFASFDFKSYTSNTCGWCGLYVSKLITSFLGGVYLSWESF